LKPGVFAGALVPLLALLVRARGGDLGANPIAEALNELGLMALVFLLASLACTPLKTLFGWVWPIRLRRMLGLFAFFYAFLHAVTYAALDQGWNLSAVLTDVTKRGFIALGFAAFLLLSPLAATSSAFAVRRLGFVRWKRLHRLTYVAGVLAVLHFLWRVKLDLSEPLFYSVTLALLFVARLFGGASAAGPGSSAGGASRRLEPRVGTPT
jgi:sulfoxide reductase heme-binding subunit YedZ